MKLQIFQMLVGPVEKVNGIKSMKSFRFQTMNYLIILEENVSILLVWQKSFNGYLRRVLIRFSRTVDPNWTDSGLVRSKIFILHNRVGRARARLGSGTGMKISETSGLGSGT